MKRRIIVEVDGADTPREYVHHTNGDDLAVNEVLLVERPKALGGNKWTFTKEPLELAGITLVQRVAMYHL